MNKKYSKISLFLRTFIFSIYSLSSIVICSIPVTFSLLFPLHVRFKLINYYLRAYMYVLRVICHIDCDVEGLENIPKDRAGVIMSNHQSIFETFFLPLIFHEPAIILKRELCWLPFFGWGLAAAEPIAIDRRKTRTAMQQVIDKGKVCLESGRFVLVFPQGTRIAPGEIGQYKLGGARLAVATGYPVIPVAHNAGRFWPRRKFIKYPGTVRMVIGPPIESKGRTPEEVMALTKAWIERTMKRIDG